MIDKTKYIVMNQDELNYELIQACCNGYVELMKYLLTSTELKVHAYINYRNNINDWNALIWACRNGHLNIIQYLLTSPELAEHANINHKSKNGSNALMYACINGHLNIIQYLLTSPELKKHADIYHKNKHGFNALMFACEEGHLDIAQYLIIDMDIKIDKETMSWIQGKNEKKEVYEDTLKVIESRNLYHQLNISIDSDTINKKKVKV